MWPTGPVTAGHSATSTVVVTRLAAAVLLQHSGHSIGECGVGSRSFSENPVHGNLHG